MNTRQPPRTPARRPRPPRPSGGPPPQVRALVGLSAGECSTLIDALSCRMADLFAPLKDHRPHRTLTTGLEKTRQQIRQLEGILKREREGGV